MKTALTTLLLIVFAAGTAPLFAQEVETPPAAEAAATEQKPSEARIKAAEELIKTLNTEEQMLVGFTSTITPMIEEMSMGLQLTAEEKQELLGIFHTWFDEDIDTEALAQKIALKYAERFSTEELNQLNDFYHTPLGQKLITEQSVITQYSTQLGIQAGQSQQMSLMRRLQPFLMKHQPQPMHPEMPMPNQH